MLANTEPSNLCTSVGAWIEQGDWLDVCSMNANAVPSLPRERLAAQVAHFVSHPKAAVPSPTYQGLDNMTLQPGWVVPTFGGGSPQGHRSEVCYYVIATT